MSIITDAQKKRIRRSWLTVDRHHAAKLMKISVRVIDQYANALQLPSAKRALIIESLTGISAEITRPDIFKRKKAS
jgi:DNA-binding transcriptional regulator YdaS (Cro superfamily)